MRNILKIGNSTTVRYIKQGSFRYTSQVCDGENGIRFGSAIASSIEAEAFYMSGAVTEVNEGDVLYYYQQYDVDSDFNPISTPVSQLVGIFTVAKCEKRSDTYSFVAYDNIQKLNIDYSAELISMESQFPMTIKSFLDALASYMSNLGVIIQVSVLSSYSMTENNSLNYFFSHGITVRDILRYFAELDGSFIYCGSGGVITFKTFSTYNFRPYYWKTSDYYIIAPTDQTAYTGTVDGTTVDLIPVFYKENGLKKEDYSFQQINRFQINSINGYEYVSGWVSIPPIPDNFYIIDNNIIASNIETTYAGWGEISILYPTFRTTILGAYSITPFQVKLFPFRNPFEAGQLIPNIIDKHGNTFQTVVMKMELTDSEVTLSCSGPEYYYTDSAKNYTDSDINTLQNVEINQLKEGLDNKVSKSGDTMTGTLVLPTVQPRQIEIVPQSGASHGGNIDFHYGGSSADYTARIIEVAEGVIRIVGDLEITNPLDINQGGTGQTGVSSTTTAADIISVSNNTFNLTSASYCCWGKVAMLQLVFTRTINTGTGANITIGTIVSGKRPAIIAGCVVRSSGCSAYGYIVPGGTIYLNAATSIPSGQEIVIDATYILP